MQTPCVSKSLTRSGVSDVYVPLSFDPGKAFQFDWSYETVVLGGHTTAVKVVPVSVSV